MDHDATTILDFRFFISFQLGKKNTDPVHLIFSQTCRVNHRRWTSPTLTGRISISIRLTLWPFSHALAHIMVNNSGGPPGGRLIDANTNEFEIAFKRHVISSHILTKAVVPGMKEEGYGRIINIISTSVNQVIPGLGVSHTIRGAVAQWVQTLAIEFSPYGITANNVLPGYIDTDRLKNLLEKSAKDKNVTYEQMVTETEKKTSLGRIGLPTEVASAVAFIASDAGGYISGTNFSVDGGRFGI